MQCVWLCTVTVGLSVGRFVRQAIRRRRWRATDRFYFVFILFSFPHPRRRRRRPVRPFVRSRAVRLRAVRVVSRATTTVGGRLFSVTAAAATDDFSRAPPVNHYARVCALYTARAFHRAHHHWYLKNCAHSLRPCTYIYTK